MTALEGKITDLGDALLQERLIIKGRRLQFIWRIGTPVKASPEDRIVRHDQTRPKIERMDLSMDLQADKKVALTPGYTDEVGNPTAAPDGATVTYSVDDSTIINLTDNGDGTAVAAATGTLGTATVHADASIPGQGTQSGDLQIVVVAGLAERMNIEAGEPEEVTPDEAAPSPEM